MNCTINALCIMWLSVIAASPYFTQSERPSATEKELSEDGNIVLSIV